MAGQVAAGVQVVGQAPGLVAGPGLEGGDELALVDQAVLKREQSEEEMAVGGGSHGVAPIVVGRSGEAPASVAGPDIKSHRARLSQVRNCLCIRAGVSPDSVDRSSPRSESKGLDTNPARRKNGLGSRPTFQLRPGHPHEARHNA